MDQAKRSPGHNRTHAVRTTNNSKHQGRHRRQRMATDSPQGIGQGLPEGAVMDFPERFGYWLGERIANVLWLIKPLHPWLIAYYLKQRSKDG